MNDRSRWITAGKAILRTLRDGWLIVGIGLFMFLALEGPYRLQGALRRHLRSDDKADSTLC